MAIIFLDTMEQMEQLRNESTSFQLNKWRDYADRISPTLQDKCMADIKQYDYEKMVFPVIQQALYPDFYKITQAHLAFLNIQDTLNQRILEEFSTQLDLQIIFYLGLCNGAGWATQLDGRNTILLGVEKIAELNWQDWNTMNDLICHEVAHHLHFTWRKGMEDGKNDSQWQIYTEGFATRYSQKLYQKDFCHLDRNGWLEYGRSHLQQIKKEYARRLSQQEGTEMFFGDWQQYDGHSNLGYYLGWEFIHWLEPNYSPKEIACLSSVMLEKLLFSFLDTTQ